MRGALACGLVAAIGVVIMASSCGSFGTDQADPPLPERDASVDDGGFVGIDAGPSPACATCSTLSAACGALDNGCGTLLSCGACGDAGSCQATDGGFACSSLPCVSNPASVTCKDRCKTVNDNCAKATSCGVCTKST